MKETVFNLFRNSPASIGLLSLLITLHLAGVKDLRTPMIAMPQDLWFIFVFYVFSMVLFVLFILPKTEQNKREKRAWQFVISSVVILTISAKVFIS